MNATIRFNDVSVNFGTKEVIKDFSEIISSGEKVVLSGPSGAGKSTLMNCIMGFVNCSKGNVEVNNKIVNATNIAQIRKQISWLPQEISFDLVQCKDLLYFPFSFEANKQLKPSESEVDTMFQQLLLPQDILSRRIEEISGGQKQRLLLASVFLLKRSILLLDEPSSALDQTATEAILKYINQTKITVISSSHDSAWIKGMSRIIQLKPIS